MPEQHHRDETVRAQVRVPHRVVREVHHLGDAAQRLERTLQERPGTSVAEHHEAQRRRIASQCMRPLSVPPMLMLNAITGITIHHALHDGQRGEPAGYRAPIR